MYDTNISALFHDSVAEIEPDVPALVRGGIDRGRVKRRRHAVGTAVVASAAVGVAAMATTIAPGVGTGDGVGPAGSPGAAASETGTATRATATVPTTQPRTKPNSPPPIPVADIPVEAADLPGLFTRLYPGKVTPGDARSGRIIDDGKAGQYAHFRWNGFATSVVFVAYRGTPAQGCRQAQQDDTSRQVPCVKRPDGTVLTTGRDTAPAVDGGASTHSAVLFTHDGYEIFVISYNSATGKGRPLAAEPPFSIAELTRAVTSKVWY